MMLMNTTKPFSIGKAASVGLLLLGLLPTAALGEWQHDDKSLVWIAQRLQ